MSIATITAPAPESAKLLKAALRAAFPATRFSVTLSRGTGYGYCHVKWTDGPTAARVDQIVAPFEGTTYDSMQDLHVSTRATLADGRRTGLRGISTDRRVSPVLARRAAQQVAAFYGLPLPVITDTSHGYWTVGDDYAAQFQTGEYWSTLIHQAASDRSRFASREG